jgi:hypothetical protein
LCPHAALNSAFYRDRTRAYNPAMARLAQVAAILLFTATPFPAQNANKRLIASALESLRETASTLPQNDSVQSILRSISWLQDRTQTWTPANATEGLTFLSSLGEILQAVRDLPAGNAARETVLTAVEEDLRIKVEHCREHGLASMQSVAVVTKRNGIEEVKGLTVLYVPKFFQAKPTGHTREFNDFSSPALADLVPGKYIIWSRENSGANRTGQPKEVQIGAGLPKGSIEVLAP